MLHRQISQLSLAIISGFFFSSFTSFAYPAIAQIAAPPDQEIKPEDLPMQTLETKTQPPLDIPEEIIEESPTLQRWLPETPNILKEIRNDPSFRSKLTLGFSLISVDDDFGGINIAIEDIFIKRTGLTISSDFQTSFDGNFINTGAELNYFIFPLGGFINLAPLVGYRYFEQDDFNTGGLDLGLKVAIALSRTGAADLTISQKFINPLANSETGLFSISIGYAITSTIRLASNWQRINFQQGQDNIFSISIQQLF